MSRFVLDASVAIRWILARETEPDAVKVMDMVATEPTRFAVPELFAFETFSVLARHHSNPILAWNEAIAPLLSTGVLRHPLTPQLATAAEPYIKCGLTGYDASYAALAALVQGKWLTFDKQAHGRIASHEVSFLLGDGFPGDLRS